MQSHYLVSNIYSINQYAIDAKDSIKNDPTNPKGYYRRGQAEVALGQLDLAQADFMQVCKMMPNDKDAREKYEATKKERKYREFSKCLDYGDKKVEVNLESIEVESSYPGPRLDEGAENVSATWVA